MTVQKEEHVRERELTYSSCWWLCFQPTHECIAIPWSDELTTLDHRQNILTIRRSSKFYFIHNFLH